MSKIIVGLDFSHIDEVLHFVKNLDPKECRVKVGKELFTAYGPQIINQLHQLGFEIFLDLKFHDIPNTVYKAIRIAANMGVWMVNVHTSGGREMLQKARAAVDESKHKPLLIAVTILTSISQDGIEEIGFRLPIEEQVTHMAKLAYECGLDGVVCSAWESLSIKKATSQNFLTVTPGIRLDNKKNDDQTRTMTPEEAYNNGVDYLVIGRPITSSENPKEIIQALLKLE